MENFILGALKDKKDKRDFRASGITPDICGGVKQTIFELPERFVPKNQLSRPSCTSQAQSHHKERQEEVKLSARFIMANTKKLEGNTGAGGYTRNSFKIVHQMGSCEEGMLPEPGAEMSWGSYIDTNKIPQTCYDNALKHKSKSYWRVENDINSIKNVLLNHKKSIGISVAWHTEFNSAGLKPGGILPGSFSNYVGGHAIEICGFNDTEKLTKCKNSWGSTYGNGGYFYIPYDVFPKIIWDCWCSLDLPSKMPVDSYYNQKRTWGSFLRERVVAFNPWLIKKIGRLPNNREIKGLAYGFYSYKSIFFGAVGDLWLNITKPEAIRKKLIDKNEKLL